MSGTHGGRQSSYLLAVSLQNSAAQFMCRIHDLLLSRGPDSLVIPFPKLAFITEAVGASRPLWDKLRCACRIWHQHSDLTLLLQPRYLGSFGFLSARRRAARHRILLRRQRRGQILQHIVLGV